MNRILGIASAALLAIACSDHAGQQIQTPDTTASLQEELRIDGSAHELVRVGGVAVREDGTIAILQPQDREVRFFGADGAPLGRFGRRGQGPGEFGSMSDLGWRADTLWVYDGSQRRFTFIAPALELARIVSFPLTAGWLAIEPGDSLVALRTVEGVDRIVHAEPSGNETRTLLILPESEGSELKVGQGGLLYSLPFENLPRHRYDAKARLAAFVMPELEGAEAGTYRVTAVTTAGDTAFSLRYAFEARPIPADSAERALQSTLAGLSGAPPEAVAAVERGIRIPSVYPPVTNLYVGMDGSLWIEHRQQDEHRPYDVIASDGTIVGRVLLPRGSRVAAATLDRIWVLEPDEFDVPSIVRFSVHWD